MLCPKNVSGSPAHGRRAVAIPSASPAMLVTAGSPRRSWRPGYWTASTSTPRRPGPAGADSSWDSGKKKGAEPPACGKQTSRLAGSATG